MTLSAMRNVLIAAFYVALIAAAQAQVSAQLAQKAPEADAIAAKAAQDGYVRIIVKFAGPVPTDQLRPDPQVLAPVMAQIAARQNAIIAAHFGSATNPTQGQGFPARPGAVPDHPDIRGQRLPVGVERIGGRSGSPGDLLRPSRISFAPSESVRRLYQ
jgi:hypothetical protein